jgi:hypothetical protein
MTPSEKMRDDPSAFVSSSFYAQGFYDTTLFCSLLVELCCILLLCDDTNRCCILLVELCEVRRSSALFSSSSSAAMRRCSAMSAFAIRLCPAFSSSSPHHRRSIRCVSHRRHLVFDDSSIISSLVDLKAKGVVLRRRCSIACHGPSSNNNSIAKYIPLRIYSA